MFEIFWTGKASKQLLKLKNRQAQLTIRDAVTLLENFPNCPNVKTLTNHEYQYRLRVGNYRVFFNANTHVEVIAIEEVKKRDERTY